MFDHVILIQFSVFFFSSRRRHTRFDCDWSSDVCSSDLIVTTRGWVMTTRASGKIGFVMLRDGTGYLQVVLSKKDVPEAAWEAFGGLTQETSAEVTGTVRADARAPGGVELTATDLRGIRPSHDFPITPKEHRTAVPVEHRHLWLRSRR